MHLMEHPLKAFRRARSLSLDTLAEQANLSKATLSRVENGHQRPSFKAMRALIDASGGALTADDFVNFEESDAPKSNEVAQ